MRIESGILFEVTNDDLDNGHLIIPEGVTEISSCALSLATDTKTVVCPSTLKVIQKSAFVSHPTLESIEFNEGLEEIGPYAFQACKKLKECLFPTSLVKLGSQAFNYCSSIKYALLSGHIKDVGVMVFGECENLKTLELATYECRYAPYLFSYCGHLETLIISSSDITLTESDLLGCDNIQDVFLNLTTEEEFKKQYNLLPASLVALLEIKISSFFEAVRISEHCRDDANQHCFFSQNVMFNENMKHQNISNLAAQYKLPDFFIDLASQKSTSQNTAASSTFKPESMLIQPYC